jgi:CRP-like cAMP-binding protein
MSISMDENSIVLTEHSVVFHENSPSTGAYLIKSGSILCLKESQGRLYPVFKAQANDVIGEEFIGMIKNHAYSAITLEETVVVNIKPYLELEILEHAPVWINALLKTLSTRMIEAQELITANRLNENTFIKELNFDQNKEMEFKKLLKSV